METIPSSVWGFILTNLKEQILYNYHLIRDAKADYQELMGCINTLNGFLKEYTKDRYRQNDYLKSITDEIRDQVLQAEDIIETFIHSTLVHKGGNLGSLRTLGKGTAKLRRMVHDTNAELVPLALGAAVVDGGYVRPEKKEEEDHSAVEAQVVGFDDKVEDVIQLLKDESKKMDLEQLNVVAITGMFGLGKTTLAKKVLKDPRIESSFACAFVKVSQDFDKRKVFLKILDAFIEITQEIKDLTDDRLAKKVEEELKKRKYLIVLDDIWTEEAWKAIQIAFPKQNDSVILITSREDHVVRPIISSEAPYKLLRLSTEKTEELLRKKAGLKSCKSDPDPDDEYVTNIAKKCQGLPLSIVLMAGIIRSKKGMIDRLKIVSDSVNAYVANDPQHTNLIRLSYDILPFHLKQCFLYLGVFHESFEIPVWKLFRLWVAEGFILPKGNMSLEAIAEDHLQDLVDRNLVMVSQRKSNGHIKTCLVHDRLRDFCKTEAITEHLFQESNQATIVNLASATYRRLCIKPELLGDIVSRDSLEYVRSFLSFAKEETPSAPENGSSISKSFKLLRVLDVKSITFPTFPDELLSLVLLKYIAISCNSNTVPEKISDLSNLQTVIYETSSPVLEVKADICKMSLLRHLHTNSSIVLIFPARQRHQSQSSQSQNLQTLCTISSECCTADIFKRIRNLKKLGIRGKLDILLEASGGSCLFAGISEFIKQVENLKLVNEGSHSSLKVLNAKSFPESLTRLTLKNTELSSGHMNALGKIKFLQVLKLKDTAFQGGKLETTDGGFHRLNVLHIGSTNLVEWESSESHFPALQCLVIQGCSELKGIPSGLGKKRSLQKIELYDPNPSLDLSAAEIEVEKLQDEETSGFKLIKHFTSPGQLNRQEPPPPQTIVPPKKSWKKKIKGFFKK